MAHAWPWPRSARPPASRASSRTPTSRTRPLAAPNPAPTAAQSRSARSATHHRSPRRDDHRRDRHLLVGRLRLHRHHRDRHHLRRDRDRHPHPHAQPLPLVSTHATSSRSSLNVLVERSSARWGTSLLVHRLVLVTNVLRPDGAHAAGSTTRRSHHLASFASSRIAHPAGGTLVYS